jgi:hypothetical protein
LTDSAAQACWRDAPRPRTNAPGEPGPRAPASPGCSSPRDPPGAADDGTPSEGPPAWRARRERLHRQGQAEATASSARATRPLLVSHGHIG